MTRGYPDWSPGVARTAEGKFLPVLVEPPIWFEDKFDNPTLKWEQANGTVNLTVNTASPTVEQDVYSGPAALYIKGAVGLFGRARSYLGTPPATNYIGISFNFQMGTASDYIDNDRAIRILYVNFLTGIRLKRIVLSYNPNSGKWYVSSDGGSNFIEILDYEVEVIYWHTLKLTVDFDNNKYLELRVNDQVVDLSSYSIYDTASSAPAKFEQNIWIYSAAAKQAELWIDNYKITYGEI